MAMIQWQKPTKQTDKNSPLAVFWNEVSIDAPDFEEHTAKYFGETR